MRSIETKCDTKVFALGGLGEVGKNMYIVMYDDEILIIDAGVMFPEDELLGIDYVIPDYTFLKKNGDKIKGLIITHGHEDHIGGIPFLLQNINIPTIYAPKMATELIKKKIEEKVKYNNFCVIEDNTKLNFKNLSVEFFGTTHSIPDSFGVSVTTPNGVIVDTGDFKFDLTPIGPMADIHKMASIGKKGVTLLLSDSTNALVEGLSASESKVDETLGDVFNRHKERIIIATFASNVYRLKHIIETCKKNNRKVALFGRSMTNNVEIAVSAGYIKEKDIFVTPEEANNLPKEQVCLLCTGSQGEPLAALSKIASGTHKQIKLMPDDVVVFSSSPIPGNSASISKTINLLCLKGVKVYTNTSLNDIHTSGHGSTEELKLMLRLIKPKYFMPVHGEYRMLKAHGDLGIECDIPKDNIFIMQNGDVLSIRNGKVKRSGSVQASDVYVDGNRIGDIGNIVIRDRKIMSCDGILVVICNIDSNTNELLGRVGITTRGFVLVNENEKLLLKIEKMAVDIIKRYLNTKKANYTDLKQELISLLTPFISDETGRRPLILPVIMDIKR